MIGFKKQDTMRTTFLNDNSEKNLRERGLRHFNGRIEDFEFYMKYGSYPREDDEHFLSQLKDIIGDEITTIEYLQQVLTKWEEMCNLEEYGLAFSYVELGTFDDQEQDYFCYQLSWGGPSDELRFYEDGTIEYVFLDWFCGVGFDVTREDAVDWLKDWFEGIDALNFETEREKYDYYDMLYDEKDKEE